MTTSATRSGHPDLVAEQLRIASGLSPSIPSESAARGGETEFAVAALLPHVCSVMFDEVAENCAGAVGFLDHG